MQDQTRSPGTRNPAGKHPHLRPQQRHPMPVRACTCDGHPSSDVQLSQESRRPSPSRLQVLGFGLRRRSPTDSGRHGTGTREECASSKYSNPALAPSLPRDCMSMLWHALIADAHGRRRCGGRFPLGHGGRWMPSPSDTLENHHHQDSGRWRWRFDDARWRVWA